MGRALALAALAGLLPACTSSHPESVAIAGWSGSAVCLAGDILIHALVPGTEYVTGPTGALVGLPLLANGGPEARAFADAC